MYYAFTAVSVTTTTTATTIAAVIDTTMSTVITCTTFDFLYPVVAADYFASTTTRAYNSSVVRSALLNVIPETLGTWRGVCYERVEDNTFYSFVIS